MIRIRLTTVDGSAGNALYSWLRADRALARTADITSGPVPPGGMGALDVIEVVLTQVTALGSLAVSVATWLDSRRESPAVTVTRMDGATLTIDSGIDVDRALIEEFLKEDRDGEER